MMQLEDVVIARLDIERAMVRLSAQEQEFIRLRFGFDGGGSGHSVQEIAAAWNLSKTRVSQVGFKSIRKLDRYFAGKPATMHDEPRTSNSLGSPLNP